MPEALDDEALRSTCLEIAQATLWEQRPIDAALITNHADALFAICERAARDEQDAGLVLRCARYLRNHYAMPPLKADTRWFSERLGCLLLLFHPMVKDDAEDLALLRELQATIEQRLTADE